MTDKNLDRLLNTDALIEAEKVTGKSYKEDPETAALGMLTQLNLSAQKKRALTAAADTFYDIGFQGYLFVLEDLGFERVLSLPFRGRNGMEDQVVYWRGDGVLAVVESFKWGVGEPGQVNKAEIHYNHRAHEKWWCDGSGGYVEDAQGKLVAYRHQDVREGLRHTLATLEEHGEFVNPWIKRPFFHLPNYMNKGADYQAVNEAVIAQLPEHVRAAVSP